jgi:hypothetical protein
MKTKFPVVRDDLGAQIEEISDDQFRRFHHEDARPLKWVQWLSVANIGY